LSSKKKCQPKSATTHLFPGKCWRRPCLEIWLKCFSAALRNVKKTAWICSTLKCSSECRAAAEQTE
jgi:hypothetical protein